jgi:ABC-type polysaccharide/polyol phosphate export permease
MPITLIPILIGTLSLSIMMAVLGVFFRDINFVLGFIFGLLFYLTPIFYPRELVPQVWQWIIDINPFYYLLSPFRLSLLNSNTDFWMALIKSIALAITFLMGAVYTWRRKQNALYFKL